MRKTILFLLLIFAVKVYSQPEFKISVEGYEWTEVNSSSLMAELQINFKIRNTGDKQGECADFEGIWLYSSSPEANSKIKLKKRATNLFKSVKPGDYLISYLSFYVPKDADDLELRFSQEYGGAVKYITESYNKYYSKTTDNKISTLQIEAEDLIRNKMYEKAIVKYILCSKYDPSLKSTFDEQIAKCYVKLGDINYDNFFMRNEYSLLTLAIDNYRLSLDYYEDVNVSKLIASLYERLGNYSYDNKKYSEATTHYEKSLKYYDEQTVKDKINLIKKLKDKPIISKQDNKESSKTSNSKTKNKAIKPKPSSK